MFFVSCNKCRCFLENRKCNSLDENKGLNNNEVSSVILTLPANCQFKSRNFGQKIEKNYHIATHIPK